MLGDVEIDKQAYGTTITGRITITNVRRDKDGHLPKAIPPHLAKAIQDLVR
jgi:hypothetical protein